MNTRVLRPDDRFAFEQSVWAATASSVPQQPCEPNTKYDVVVIGGGIAGAVATLTLAKTGTKVLLIEAGKLGSGATGRSGGYVVPSFARVGPQHVIDSLGEQGEQMVSAIAGSADFLFNLVREHDLDCDAGQGGWIRPTRSQAQLDGFEAEAEVWRRYGGDVTVLDAKETEAHSGIPLYLGASFSPNGGTIHPVKFVRQLMLTAGKFGAEWMEDSPALDISRNAGRWTVKTAKFDIFAENVLVCTNGQSRHLTPALYRSLVPALICHFASDPVAASDRQDLFGQGKCLSDTRVNLFTYRFDSDWRIISGTLPTLHVGDGSRLGNRIRDRLKRTLKISGELKSRYVWFGRASVTDDQLPRACELGPGAYAFSACNGRGLSMSACFGAEISRYLVNGGSGSLSIPVAAPRPFRNRTMARIGARFYPFYGAAVDFLKQS